MAFLAVCFSILSLLPQGANPTFQLPSARDLAMLAPDAVSDKVVYLEIARSSCSRCAAQAGAVNELRKKYKDRGLEIVTVYDEIAGGNANEDPFARALADANQKQYQHPIALNDGGEFHNSYYSKIKGTPSAFLVSPDGKVEFLGLDPLAEPSRAQTTAKIEAALAAPRTITTKPTPPQRLDPFSLLLYSGGVLRSSDLVGKPSLIVTWLPGPAMERLAPSLEKLQNNLGDKLRIVAVTFSDFDQAAESAARLCPSVTLAAPDSRAHAALDAARVPQMLFIGADGNIAKRISTLYGTAGIEASILDRYGRILTKNSNATLQKTSMIRDAETGCAFLLPNGFQQTEASGAKVEYVSNKSRLRSKLYEGTYGTEGINRLRQSISTTNREYQVHSEEKLQNGAYLLSDEWETNGERCRGFRVFVNTPKGIVEIELSGPLSDFDRNCNDFRSTAESLIVERK